MASLNRCEFIGRLGRDPEVRNMQDGSPVVNLSVGVTEKWKDKNSGEQREKTEWVRIVIFNEHLCKVAQNYIKKGDLIRVVGAMQTRKWTDQAGIEKYTTEIVLQRYRGELTMLGSNQGGQNGSGNSEQSQGDYQQNQIQGGNDLDDQIPF